MLRSVPHLATDDGRRLQIDVADLLRCRGGVANAPAPRLRIVVAEDAPTCPKCGTTRSCAARACPRCGLAEARMDAYGARHDHAPPPLVAAWDHACERWDDDARHDALFDLARRHDALDWLARSYRGRADAIAARQLERIVRVSTALLWTSRESRPEPAASRPYRGCRILLVAAVLAIIGGGLIAHGVASRSDAAISQR